MSVEKLDFSFIKQEQKPFTTHLNVVLQNLKDGFALGVYCFLTSLPPGWNVNREHLMSHFEVGREKIGTTLKYLKDNLLISYVRQRNKDGTLGAVGIEVKCGYEYERMLKNKPPATLPETRSVEVNHTTGLPECGKTAPIKETININKKEKLKDIVQMPLDDKSQSNIVKIAHDLHFDEFWAAYPRKENKIDARETWIKARLDGIAVEIIADVRLRQVKHDRWEDRKFIPLPKTYLNAKGWTNEIVERQKGSKQPVTSIRSYAEKLIDIANQHNNSQVVHAVQGNLG
jgi:hypothetical protein